MARILIIDDEEAIRIALRRMLEGAGHEVIEATEGAHGMRLYKQDPTPVVITDILMPEKEGFEVIRELQQVNPDVCIIAVSGSLTRGGPDFLPQAGDMGARFTLPKPFSRDDVLKVVAAALGEEQEEGGAPESETARILIIDDDVEILNALRKLFEDVGFEIVTATTSEEGVEMYRADPTDLVITDIFVPVEGGLEVIRKLKQSHPDSKIVAITGYGIRDELDAITLAKQMGADLAYEKPMDFQSFRQEVEALLH